MTAAEQSLTWEWVALILGGGALFVLWCWVIVRAGGGARVTFKDRTPTWSYERTVARPTDEDEKATERWEADK